MSLEPRPGSTGIVFDAEFGAPTDADGNQVADPFKEHGNWDFVTRGIDYNYSLPTGYQQMTIIERNRNPLPLFDPSADQPGGAELEAQRCLNRIDPCDRGGDAGINRAFVTKGGDSWHAEAWVLLGPDVRRITPESFKARVTMHFYDRYRKFLSECAPNGTTYLAVAVVTHIETICPVPPGDQIRYVSVTARAHADKDPNYPEYEMAGASGSIMLDRFKLTLVTRA